jgi:hypothetical protein
VAEAVNRRNVIDAHFTHGHFSGQLFALRHRFSGAMKRSRLAEYASLTLRHAAQGERSSILNRNKTSVRAGQSNQFCGGPINSIAGLPQQLHSRALKSSSDCWKWSR